MASMSRSRVLLLAVVTALIAGLFAGPVAARPASNASNNSSEKLREAVTLQGVQRHLEAFQDIADAAGGNRFAGLQGHDESAQHVFDQLSAAGYTPTYQEFTYDAFFELTPAKLFQVSPNETTYVNGNDFRVMSYSGSDDVTGPIAVPAGDHRGCRATDYEGFPAGHVALVQRGAPADFTASCTFRLKTDNAIAAGASAVLVYNNVPGVLAGTLGAGPLSTIPSLGLTQSLGEQLRALGSVTMRAVTDTDSDQLTTRNVLAETALGDPDNVVMVGAHLDSVTTGPGINDNGTGSAAILETAIQMAKVEPRNKVRFAWWSAEESGLVGARHYVANLPQAERDKLALYLNFDMIGSPNFVRFIYDGDNSAGLPSGALGPPGSAAIEQLFIEYFDAQGLASEPTPFNGRSDYGPFIENGIPAGGLFTGAEGVKTEAQAATYGGTAGQAYDPCYHAACDDIGNISATGLDQMSDAVAHAVITYAQNTEAVNGVEGKGNARQPLTGATNGGSTPGGGGGLHDDHDHDAES